jgi:c-di-GMP-binding flagellar brake protein YcgR
MMQTSGLTVRQFQREAVELDAEFIVAEEHRDQVRFSPMSGAAEPYMTRGRIVDISAGGMGLLCEQFVPRMCQGVVRVTDPRVTAMTAAGVPGPGPAFEHRVVVRRASLSGPELHYSLGVAFVDPEPGIDDRIAMLLRWIHGHDGRTEPPRGDDA